MVTTTQRLSAFYCLILQDVFISLVLALAHLAGGVTAAYFASLGSESLVRNGLATSSVSTSGTTALLL